MPSLKFLDLFAGIGGMRLGFERAGFECIMSIEINDESCKTFEANFGESPKGDVTKLDPRLLSDFDVLVGGFPCQPFSMAGHRLGLLDQTRGTLFFDLAKILEEKSPPAFLLENVHGLLNHDDGKTMKVILDVIKGLGYNPRFEILNAKDFGVPQKRARIFIAGFKSDAACEFEFPSPVPGTKPLRDCLESWVSSDYYLSKTYLAGLERHKSIQESKGRGFGYEILDTSGTANALVCGGMGRERNLIIDHNVPSPYPQSRNERHARMLTVRECARLQGFPDSFIIPVSKADAYRQFGNSVAIPVVEAVAKSMRTFLEKTKVP